VLIDMNAYFASVEQVSNPLLRGKPIVVCGEGRTVVTTASYEARKFGVKTAMSLYEARALCPQVIAVCGNMDKYVDTSLKIHKILLDFSDQVEPFSIDECFMDITHLCSKGVSAKDVAKKMKGRIKNELGLLCSAGIGPNKVIAKLASKLEKPDGLVEIKSGSAAAFLENLPVEELQGVGVGRKTSAKLRLLGIYTAGRLGAASEDFLRFHFGVMGSYLKNVGLGLDYAGVKKYSENDQIKSVGHSHTLPRDTRDMSVVRSYLMMLSQKTGERLRRYGLTGGTVSIVIRYGDFRTFSKQNILKNGVKTPEEIYGAAKNILAAALPLSGPVRLVGIRVSGLSRDDGQQFLLDDINKSRVLSEQIYELNKKYGEFTVKPSSVLIAEKFGVSEGCGMRGRHMLKKP